MLGVHKTRTIHPQCDGMVECFNRTLIDQLAKILQQQQGEWDDYLSQLALAYNTSRHSSTGFTPFFLTHGREARLLTNLLLPNCVPRSPSNLPADYAGDLMCKLQDVFTIATQNREHAYHQQKWHYDKGLKFTPYQWGDLVWLHDPTTIRQKLVWLFGVKGWCGCHRIHYLLDESDKRQIVHYNRLRPYHAPVPQKEKQNTPSTLSPSLTALSGALLFKLPQVALCTSKGTSKDPILPQTPLAPGPHPFLADPLPASPPLTQSSSSGPAACLGRCQVKLARYLKDYVLT